MSKTIVETIEQMHSSLRDYIEATYHIGHPALIAQRRELLDRTGVIHQIPYLESTPRYQTGSSFRKIEGLSQSAIQAFELLATRTDNGRQVLYDPPYSHQCDAIRYTLVEGKNLVIMTGTGSGKTESFLLPILGKLAREAAERPQEFAANPAMRALVLYPMNALVNDQLGRLRAMFGDKRLVELFIKWSGRPPRFARYTSRTPYAGVRTSKKDQRKLKSFEQFYVDMEICADGEPSSEQAAAANLRHELKARGKWPAKPSLAAWLGEKNSHWVKRDGTFLRAIVQPEDSELLTRHEVQAAPPDLLVTNYSMLEYMLMRPIERKRPAVPSLNRSGFDRHFEFFGGANDEQRKRRDVGPAGGSVEGQRRVDARVCTSAWLEHAPTGLVEEAAGAAVGAGADGGDAAGDGGASACEQRIPAGRRQLVA